MNATTEFAENGGIAGKLTFSVEHENGVVSQRELDLPRERYTSCGRVWGDGSRQVTSNRCKLQENGEAILFSVLLSTEPNGSVVAMDKERGVTGANDTVVQYRLVTADYVRDWPEDGENEQPLRQFGPDQIYVPERCLYMSPLSSFAAMGGDSGYRYLMNDRGFYKTDRSNTTVVNLADGEGWEDWQEFPWSEKEWEELFWPESSGKVLLSGAIERKYCPLSEREFLLRVDGALWLVELRGNLQTDPFIYSIYTLVPEYTKGSAQWEVVLTANAIAFPFVFDMEYDEISAVCTERPLMDLDGFEHPTGEIGLYSTKSDHALVFPEGHTVYWYPYDADRVPANQAEISVAVQKDGQTLCFCTIYIRSWVEAETGNRTYTATLVGTGLVMEQNPDGGAIIRLK